MKVCIESENCHAHSWQTAGQQYRAAFFLAKNEGRMYAGIKSLSGLHLS